LTQYYYLVASLPMLFFEEAPPFSSAAWLDLCREQISESDHALLTRIAFNELRPRPGDPGVWRDYSSWETALRNELAVQRALKLGLSPDSFLRQTRFYCGLPAVVKEALGAGTPMAVETALDRRRWSRLDELETGTQFDLGRLIVYRLKLLLLERKNRFRPEPGRQAFVLEYTQVLDTAAAWMSAASPLLDTEKRYD
jgi:hypothetical protein